jgi:DnaJ homolog subfamily C member 28
MTDRDKPKEEQPAKRPPLTRQNYHSVIDQIMARAQADGLMDNLPGQGKPLNLGDDDLVPDEYRLGFRMLKSSGFAPPWVEARRELDAERARLAQWLTRTTQRWPHLAAPARETLRAEYRKKLDDLQRLIVSFNLTAPPGVDHIEGLRIAEELGKLGE